MFRRTFYFLIFLIVFHSFSCFVTRKLIFMPKGQAALPNYKGKLWKSKMGNETAIGYFSRGNKKLIVAFHGQHGTIHTFAPMGLKFFQAGYSVLLVEYPGYGLSKTSSSSESNVYRDSETLIRDVQTKENFSVNDTILLGYSLGSGVAVEMANRKLGSQLILLAPFTSIPAVASHRFVPILPYFLIWDRFDSIGKASKIQIPVLILHGKKDKIVPHFMGEELQKAFPKSELLSIPGFDHYVFGALEGKIWSKILSFIEKK